MPALTIRDLDDAVHEYLRRRARRNGRSLEAEVCAVLKEETTPPQDRGERLGSTSRRWKAVAGPCQVAA
jgi:plasmid stability protein